MLSLLSGSGTCKILRHSSRSFPLKFPNEGVHINPYDAAWKCVAIMHPPHNVHWISHTGLKYSKQGDGGKKGHLVKLDDFIKKSLKPYPSLYKYYKQMLKGFNQQFNDFKVWRMVSSKQSVDSAYKTSYHEEKAIHDLKESFLRSCVLLPVFLMPMGIVWVFIPVACFPQYLLPRCYWSSDQRNRFMTKMYSARASEYLTVIGHLKFLRDYDSSPAFQRTLGPILSMIREQKVPSNDDLMSLKHWCRNRSNPLHLNDVPPLLMQTFAAINFLWKYQPTSWITHHLYRRVLLILELDGKLLQENLLFDLTDTELQDATFLRGLNGLQLSRSANQYWLNNWMNLTKICDRSDTSFILHAMVLQSVNYTEVKYMRKVFD